ncbi:hypothetical protein ACLOJK_035061 [Asimina triloba]
MATTNAQAAVAPARLPTEAEDEDFCDCDLAERLSMRGGSRFMTYEQILKRDTCANIGSIGTREQGPIEIGTNPTDSLMLLILLRGM